MPTYPPSEVDPQRAQTVTPFAEWTPPGITVPEPPKDLEYTLDNVDGGLDGWSEEVAVHGRDSHGNTFARLEIDRSAEHKREKQAIRNQRYRERRRANDPTVLNQVSLEDSFKLGEEGTNWKEDGTCTVDNDLSRPPFARLTDASNHFFYSRAKVFSDIRTRSLWNTIRYVLGLKADFAGLHWPGTGPGAQAYKLNAHARRDAPTKLLDDIANGVVGEACPLVRCPEQAVRGLLAIARREVDAVWEEGRAVLFAKMFAALMGYLDQYEILADDHIAPAFKRALKIALAGPRLIRDAHALDDEFNDAKSLNRTAWAKYGGSYGKRGDNGGEKAKAEKVDEGDEDDGGWGAPRELILEHAMEELSLREADNVLAPLYAPLALDAVHLQNYISFSRRIVTAVVPPTPTDGPAFMSSCYRLRTARAPWSEEERWREPGTRARADKARQDAADAEGPPEEFTFELETNSVEDPDELDVWIEGGAVGLGESDDGAKLVGMGIRARWAQIGVDGGPSWWILKLKDYILPSVWRSTLAERDAAKNDPPVPEYDMAALMPMEVPNARLGVAPNDGEALVENGVTEGVGTAIPPKKSTADKPPAEKPTADTADTTADTSADKPIAGHTTAPATSTKPHSSSEFAAAHDVGEDDGDGLPNVVAVLGADEDAADLDDDGSSVADSKPELSKNDEAASNDTDLPGKNKNLPSDCAVDDK